MRNQQQRRPQLTLLGALKSLAARPSTGIQHIHADCLGKEAGLIVALHRHISSERSLDRIKGCRTMIS